MIILVIGLNHKTTPVALREKVAFTEEEGAERMAEVVALESVAEAVLVSTCNRVELHLVSPTPDGAMGQVMQWLAKSRGVSLDELQPHLYVHQGAEAIAHGFKVAASLDSLVVGEAQILGQIKAAYQSAAAAGSAGTILNRYFHHMFRVAKRVRTETAIAQNAVSIASTAVTLARKIFGDLSKNSCLLIGAGEMCELAARHLVSQGIGQVMVTNRTFARAEELAGSFEGHAFPLEDLAQEISRADIVISSTGSTRYIVSAEMMRAALKRRRNRPMFLIDIAVPRDIDPLCADLNSLFLYDIDDLSKIVEENRNDRLLAAVDAEEIITQEVPDLMQWIESLQVVPTIVSLREQMEQMRDDELARTLKLLEHLHESDQARVKELANRLMNKMLHSPVSQLKRLSGGRDGNLYVDALRKLFGLG